MVRNICLVLACLASSVGARAETLWQIEIRDGAAAPEMVEIWANDENIRMGIKSDEDAGEVIFIGARNEAIMVDHERKQYFVVSAERMGAAMTGMKSQMEQAMAAAMANMDPETKKAMQAAMAQNGGSLPGLGALPGMAAEAPVIEVRAAGETKPILSAKASRFDVLENGKKVSELWAAKPGDVKGGKVVSARMADLMAFFDQAMGDFSPADDSLFQYLSRIDGRVPVAGVDFENGAAGETSQLVSAADADAPDGVWDAPAGYQKMESPF